MSGNVKTAAGRSAQEIITKLAQHIDYFNKYQPSHSIQMADLAAILAGRLGLVHADIEAIVEAALLHDIGLYETAPAYIFNPGPLTTEQRMDLWRHSIIGEQAMARRNASRHSQLLVRWHHERWNGTGYPDALSFEEIPIGARILHAVELYCALRADRPYRSAIGGDESLELLRSSAGLECDPFVVQKLLALLRETSPGPAEVTLPAEAMRGPELQEHIPAQDSAVDPQLEAGPSLQGDRAALEQSWPEQAARPSPAEPGSVASVDQCEPLVGIEPDTILALAKEDAASPPKARGWLSSACMTGSLLGFQVSVLRQMDFRCVALPICGSGDLAWYFAALGKQVLSNDPRPWAALAGRAAIDSQALDDEQVLRILQDTYIPGARMSNPELRRWFGEADAWWLDNLHSKAMADAAIQDQVLMLGMRAGDYALSFTNSTSELKRPLTVIFRELAAGSLGRLASHPYNRAYNRPIQEFLRDARADLMYLNLPPGQAEFKGPSDGRSWRDVWVGAKATDVAEDFSQLVTLPQSKRAYLERLDRILASAARIRKWAIECRDIGLASARDISDLLKAHRAIQATYSKDVTEVPGGQRNYIMVAELV